MSLGSDDEVTGSFTYPCLDVIQVDALAHAVLLRDPEGLPGKVCGHLDLVF